MFDFRKLKRTFIVAEISANHGQSLARAKSLIKKAKDCGVDAVKFQAYTPETLTIDCGNKYFKIKHPKWGGQTLFQLYKKAYTPWNWFKQLKKTADDLGLIFFATAFDKAAVDFLEGIGVPFHKIASFELVDLPLIEYTVKTGKTVILSTGMASFKEISEAVRAARGRNKDNIVLLRCVSSYPARPEEMNLRTILHMKNKFGVPVGISDHTLGTSISVAAVALGAIMVEKHFTLSRKNKTPDSFFSLEPRELKMLVENIRDAEKALGGIEYGLTPGQKKNIIFRRSLFAVEDIKAGEEFSENNIRSIRPWYGLVPKYQNKVFGRKAKRDIKRGTPIKWNLVKIA